MTLLRRRRGQATTETVLLLPIFMLFLYIFVKIYGLLILVQKVEIASFYAARRWQLESHRNVNYVGDDGNLQQHITEKVRDYLGYGKTAGNFLDLMGTGPQLDINRTQVWQVLTLTFKTKAINLPFIKDKNQKRFGMTFESTKYVPNRDRPIAFILPGLNS